MSIYSGKHLRRLLEAAAIYVFGIDDKGMSFFELMEPPLDVEEAPIDELLSALVEPLGYIELGQCTGSYKISDGVTQDGESCIKIHRLNCQGKWTLVACRADMRWAAQFMCGSSFPKLSIAGG